MRGHFHSGGPAITNTNSATFCKAESLTFETIKGYMMQNLEDKIFAVTGAGTGIGKAIAIERQSKV